MVETRERILAAASDLFSLHGYFGTSTREIAAIVGIRQPSMYAHFASKAAIMHELLELNIGAATRAARLVSQYDASPAARLYRLITADIAYIVGLPYDLGGSLTRGVLEDEEFATWVQTYDDLHEIRQRLISAGVEAGQFRPVDPRRAERNVAAVLASILMSGRGHVSPGEAVGDDVADFLLGSLVVRFSQVQAFAKEARALPDPYLSEVQEPTES